MYSHNNMEFGTNQYDAGVMMLLKLTTSHSSYKISFKVSHSLQGALSHFSPLFSKLYANIWQIKCQSHQWHRIEISKHHSLYFSNFIVIWHFTIQNKLIWVTIMHRIFLTCHTKTLLCTFCCIFGNRCQDNT